MSYKAIFTPKNTITGFKTSYFTEKKDAQKWIDTYRPNDPNWEVSAEVLFDGIGQYNSYVGKDDDNDS